MRKKLLGLTSFLLVAPLYAALALPLTSINQLIVFGDSLSDNGNAAAVLGGTLPGNYAPNAFTDGPNTTPATSGPFGLWIDQLAPQLHLPDPQPFLTGGTNFAVASAQTGSANPQDIGNQLAAFSAAHLGNAPSNALYVIWGGANDIFNATNPSQAATQALTNLNSDILTLEGEGARYFLWLDLPPLGNTPRGTASNQVAAWNTAASLFDTGWQTDLTALQNQGLQIVGVSIDQLFNMIANNPSAYHFSNITDPAQGLNVNPNTYLFWDDQHPTTAGGALIADAAFNALAGPTAVPEPLNAGLALTGFCLFLALQKFRRKNAAKS